MKNLLDHLDFLVLAVSPYEEIFEKKAFVLTTGAGSAAAIKPISKNLKHWGVNRVYSLGLRMLNNQWNKMPASRQAKFEKRLRVSAKAFYKSRKTLPHLSTVAFYHVSKMVVKKICGRRQPSL